MKYIPHKHRLETEVDRLKEVVSELKTMIGVLGERLHAGHTGPAVGPPVNPPGDGNPETQALAIDAYIQKWRAEHGETPDG